MAIFLTIGSLLSVSCGVIALSREVGEFDRYEQFTSHLRNDAKGGAPRLLGLVEGGRAGLRRGVRLSTSVSGVL